MLRLFSPIIFLVLILPLHGQVPTSPSEEVPRDATRQNAPCVDQPKSLAELATSFQKGRFPLASHITGTWVEIGTVSEFPPNQYQTNPHPTIYKSLNCSGEKRGIKFEFVLVANGYSVELHAIGMTYPQKITMEPDHNGSVTFPVDFAADEGPDTYRCRLTQRDTLACLSGPFSGMEFKRMTIKPEEIYDVPVER